jgi:hypothetical protein
MPVALSLDEVEEGPGRDPDRLRPAAGHDLDAGFPGIVGVEEERNLAGFSATAQSIAFTVDAAFRRILKMRRS